MGNSMNGRTDMIRRLILVLQSVSLILIIVMFIGWLIVVVNKDGSEVIEIFFFFLLSFIPFTLLILGKYIVSGKFYIFKEKVEEQ